MSKRFTTSSKLQKALADNLVTVANVIINCDDGTKKQISAEQFTNDLDFYAESGIFADTLDFQYEPIADDKLFISIGKKSAYCFNEIDVTLQLANGVQTDTVTGQLYESFCK